MRLKDFDAQLVASGELSTRNRVLFSSIESTNAMGKRIAYLYQRSQVDLPSTVLVAMEQTAGRGRLGNRWLSPPGGIYVSLVQAIRDRNHLSTLPMQVATRLCGELDAILDAPCRVKWPNDLMVNGKKVGGILIESVGSGSDLAAVVGFGINYSCDLPVLSGSATAVSKEAVDAPSMAQLTARLIGVLETGLLNGDSPERIVEEYSRWSSLSIGQEIRCKTTVGSHTGSFRGFDDRGFLLLQTASGEESISAGQIIEGGGGEHHES